MANINNGGINTMRNTKTIYDLTQFEKALKLLKEWGNEPDKIWTFERLVSLR